MLHPTPPDPTLETDYKVSLDIFEGPLDLLLYLIKRDEVDVQNVSIERVTQQYLDYLQTFSMLKRAVVASTRFPGRKPSSTGSRIPFTRARISTTCLASIRPVKVEWSC